MNTLFGFPVAVSDNLPKGEIILVNPIKRRKLEVSQRVNESGEIVFTAKLEIKKPEAVLLENVSE